MKHVTPMLLGLGVGGVTMLLVLVAGGEMIGVPVGLAVGLLTSTRAARLVGKAKPVTRGSNRRERASVADSIGLEDGLADLLFSASRTAAQRLGHGKIAPFLMYETPAGKVAFREVLEPDPGRWLARAREAARALEDSRRVVTSVPWEAPVGDRLQPVILYEAAVQGDTERTLSFIQGYRHKRLMFAGAMTTPVQYVGDGAHTLRFRPLVAGDGA